MSNRILCQNHYIDNDTWATGLNNNDCIIGPSGAGKTRGYVLPNLLQCAMEGKESLIVTDTKGNLRKTVSKTLRERGYQVVEINFRDCAVSPCGYNPLIYIRQDAKRGSYNEQDIMQVASILSPVNTKHDPFWELSARMALAAMIGYVLEYLPYKEHHLGSVIRLSREMGTGKFDSLMEEVCVIAPNSFTAVQYQMLKNVQGSQRTYSSILAFIAEKLSPFAFHGAQRLFTFDRQIRLQELGREKTAVFLNVSDTDRSMDALVTLFYAQALQVLCRYADQQPDNRLRVPVRLIMDDFAAGAAGCIPDFDQITSVIRSREISVSIILQSLSQLEAIYGHHKAITIVNNCDHLLYLGGQDVETAKYISVKANKSVHTILDMPLDHAWLFTRGSTPQEVQKYTLESHPLYRAPKPATKDYTPELAEEFEA